MMMNTSAFIKPVDFKMVDGQPATSHIDFVAFYATRGGYVDRLVRDESGRVLFVCQNSIGQFDDAREAWERGEQDVLAMLYASKLRLIKNMLWSFERHERERLQSDWNRAEFKRAV